MLEIIINTIFSVPYLVIGVLVAALLDVFVHYTKITTRFTFIEIWGCVMFWPAILIVGGLVFIKGKI